VTYMFILKCALKFVLKNILYYDARSEKHHSNYNIYTFRRFITILTTYRKCPRFIFLYYNIQMMEFQMS